MLHLENIIKEYVTGQQTVQALKGVTLTFRKSEFVSVLGPSGCGKTTLLNLIGGLDRYTSGDIAVDGISTKTYKDRDWDTYRNHRIGFVFQSYNLIPHQSILSNVELALTLSGVSKAERKKRAIHALEQVGLSDQIYKKPNQMSGGQMQRVAIARALVNDPDILLADEPTGALDSVTSVQIMDILKEISKDKLIIMVTHNPELAEQYSTRIIKLRDGVITDDSHPYNPQEESTKSEIKKDKKKEKKKHTSMSLFTAFHLSLNNLMTKKGRTILTSFAGSIGIIGIALILSLSHGIQAYIDLLQEDTLSSYPITIEAESMDMTSMMQMFADSADSQTPTDSSKIYSKNVTYNMVNAMTTTQTNNLKDFKTFLDTDEQMNEYVSAIQYGYGQDLLIYADSSDEVRQLNPTDLFSEIYGTSSSFSSVASNYAQLQVWDEILTKDDGTGINPLIQNQYDVIAGKWPEKFNEVVLVVDENNTINDTYIYCLGLKDSDEISQVMDAMAKGEKVEQSGEDSWNISDILGMTFKLVIPTDRYQYNPATETWTDKSENQAYMNLVLENAQDIVISGIIRPNPDASAASLQCAIAYTKDLTDYYLEQIRSSDIVQQQMEEPTVDVLTGLKFDDGTFDTLSAEQKVEQIRAYYADANALVCANAYKAIMTTPTDAYLTETVDSYMEQYPDRDSLEAAIVQLYQQQAEMDAQTVQDFLDDMTDEELDESMRSGLREMVAQQYKEQMTLRFAQMSTDQLTYAMTGYLDELDEETLPQAEEQYLSDTVAPTTLEENQESFGYAESDSPSTINLYVSTFEDKEVIAQCIERYNSTVENEEDKISYTDYVGLMMSSITTMVDAVSYGLIAFVAISLVVSSIMIGIITYISVLERTKEIGILRSIGASKKDISRVFNAETLIIGLTSGLIGIGLTVLLCWPINALLNHLTNISALTASLPWEAAVILVIISMVLTLIAGVIPSRVAAKKDPVEALRTE